VIRSVTHKYNSHNPYGPQTTRAYPRSASTWALAALPICPVTSCCPPSRAIVRA
jgi:hypothetical protein